MYNGLMLLFPAFVVAVGLIAGELRSPARRLPEPTGTARSSWLRNAAAIAGSHLLAGVLVLLIAVLLTLNLVLWCPSFGAVIELYEQF